MRSVAGIFRLDGGRMAQALFTVLIAIAILGPIWMVLQGGFNDAGPYQSFRFGTAHWREALSDPKVVTALGNTFFIIAVRTVLGLAIAIPLAWLVARTNIPGARLLEFGFWIAFFMPSIAYVQGAMFLFDWPHGLVHQFIHLLSPALDTRFLDIYSYGGIIFVHLLSQNVSALFVLLVISFRNMDSSLEEASRISGASTLCTMRNILLPLSRPMIAVLVVLAVIRGMQSYEIETILGSPVGIDVYSTLIVAMISDQPPRLAQASALSTLILLVLVPLILFQRLYVGRHQYTTISSKMRTATVDLRGWRWPAFALVSFVVLSQLLVPSLGTLCASLMKRAGFFFIDNPWTFAWWHEVLTNREFLEALSNTVVIGLGAGFFAGLVSFLAAYLLVRTQFVGRGAVDFITWLPWAVPGVLLSLGILAFILSNPVLKALHGTVFILILAMVLFRFPLGVQLLKSNLTQISRELEEAALICGASRLRTQLQIILPLMLPMIVGVGLMAFVGAVTEVSGVILLASTEQRTLPLLSLDYLTGREASKEMAAVITTIMVALSIGVALGARMFGIRLGEAAPAEDGATEGASRRPRVWTSGMSAARSGALALAGLVLAAIFAAPHLVGTGLDGSAAGGAASDPELQRLVAAARREGSVIVWAQGGHGRREFYKDAFEKAFPGIEVELFQAPVNSQRDNRYEQEFKAGIFKADVFVTGGASAVSRFMKVDMVQPLRPYLEPSTLAPARWTTPGGPVWMDNARKYVLVGDALTYPTATVNSAVHGVTSYEDLLRPEFDGKIVMSDPAKSGSGFAFAIFLENQPGLGREYIRKLFRNGRIVFNADDRTQAEWVDSGRALIGLNLRPQEVQSLKDVGGTLKIVGPLTVGGRKVGFTIGSDGVIWLPALKPLPHPNATRLYVNWFYSAAGQQAMVDALDIGTNVDGVDLSRVSEWSRPRPGVTYMNLMTEDLTSAQAATSLRQFINEAIKRK